MKNVKELSVPISDESFESSVLFRLGVLFGSTYGCRPKCHQLTLELCREVLFNFDFNEEAPEKLRINLKHKYSHRLLKTTLNTIGYRTTSKKPNCADFYAVKLNKTI